MIGKWRSLVDDQWHRLDEVTGEYVAEVWVDDTEDGNAHIIIRSPAGELRIKIDGMGRSNRDIGNSLINAKNVADVALWGRAEPDPAGQCRTFRDNDYSQKAFWGRHWVETWGLT